MSKSKNNGVDPTVLVGQYGADSVRLFMMFKSPPEDTLEWSDDGVEGAARFMRRLWRMVWDHLQKGRAGPVEAQGLTDEQRTMRRAAHATLVKVSGDLGRRRVFNTAIAAVMELMNSLAKFQDASAQGRAIVQEALELIVQMLAPIVPHVCHVLWRELGHGDQLIDRAWPQPDAAALVADSIEIVVQVDGKVRGHVTVAANADKAQIEAAALDDPAVQKWTQAQGKEVKKVIVLPQRKLVSVVTGLRATLTGKNEPA
jgi:leucyl-tRNA synthetase